MNEATRRPRLRPDFLQVDRYYEERTLQGDVLADSGYVHRAADAWALPLGPVPVGA